LIIKKLLAVLGYPVPDTTTVRYS